jgi:hypothetical protein
MGTIAGYVAAVVVALVAFTVAIFVRIGVMPSADANGAVFSVEFVVLVVLHWVIVLVPFIGLRKCGGFDNAWFSTLVGGVLTAFLYFHSTFGCTSR